MELDNTCPQIPKSDDKPAKRKRITLACHRCRQKKGKCDGSRPSCSTCRTAQVECQWPDPDQDGRKHKRMNKQAKETSEYERQVDFDSRNTGYAENTASISLYPPLTPPSINSRPSTSSPGSVWTKNPQANAPSPSHSAFDLLLAAALPDNNTQWAVPDGPTPANTKLPSLDVLTRLPSTAPPKFEDVNVYVNQDALVLKYHRPFGPTAIQPGLEQISIAFRAPLPGSRYPSPGPTPPETDGGNSFSFEPIYYTSGPPSSGIMPQPSPSLPESPFDLDSDIPRPSILQRLLPLFFSRMGCHFPFLTEQLVLSYIDHEDASKRVTAPLLINSICALASRFSETPIIRSQIMARSPATYGIPFAEKAKQLLLPLFGYPSTNTVASLVLLAYFCFGLNNEGALWAYSGMALRMAVDLGLHTDVNSPSSSPESLQRCTDRLLWWSCFILDRILAFGTGRTVTVKDREIKAPLPADIEIYTVQRYSNANPTADPTILYSEPKIPSPFPHVVKMFQLYGFLCEIVNSVDPSWTPPNSDPAPDNGHIARHPESGHTLVEIEDQLNIAYGAIPGPMRFTSENLQMHTLNHTAPTFLSLHLWYNCMIITLYQTPLIHKDLNAAKESLEDRLAVITNCCQSVCSMLTAVDIVDSFSYLASPFVNQAFFVVACACVKDYRIRTGRIILSSETGKGLHSSNILAQTAVSNFKRCKRALARQSAYWMGVMWIEAVVEKLASQKMRPSLQNATEGVDTFVSPADMVIFRRLVQRTTGASPSANLSPEGWKTLFSAFSQGSGQNPSFSQDDWALAYSFASFTADSTLPDSNLFVA